MAINAGSVFVDLGARLDRREFDAYERKLKETQERVARKERFKATLGANYDERTFRSYQRDLDRAERQNNDMVRANGRLRTSFGQVWSRGGAAFAAAGGAFAVVSAVKSVTKAYGESQVSQEKMRAQLKALGFDYDAHAKQIDEVIQKTSQLAGLDDEDLQDAFTNIVRVTGNVNKSLKLTGLAADFARAKHIDVAKAGEIVGKVAGGNTGILSRYGIQIDKGATATEALGKLQEKFKGQAEAYGKTQAGSMDRVQVAFENLQEVIGKRLGPWLTRAANSLADFINEMGRGEGSGGKFVDLLQGLARGFTLFARGVRTTAGIVAKFFEMFMRSLQLVGEAGSHLPGVGGKFKALAQDADRAADKLRDFKKRMDISVEAGQVRDDLEKMRKKTGSSLTSIRKFTVDGMKVIRTRLGTDSKEGTDALGRHYDHAVAMIRTAMRRGRISTATGLAEIRRLMFHELETLGISSAQAKGKPLTQDPAKANRAQRYMGGWMGQRGEIGHDTIPAMLAPGEAVLNRHQQGVIEGMLGEGFLDRLFATVQRPHFMARGGRALRRFAGGGMAGAVAAADQLDRAHFPYKWGGGHQATPAPFGPMDCSGAVSYVLQHAGVNIPTLTSGLLANRGNPGEGALTVWANPVHTFMRIGNRFFGTSGQNPGGGAGWFSDPGGGYRSRFAVRHFGGGDFTGGAIGMPDPIKAPVVGGSGMLHDIAQGVLTRTAAAATEKVRSLAASAGLGTGDVGDPGPSKGKYGFGDLKSLWTSVGGRGARAAIMARIALAESGGDPTARNPSGASGLWQILGLPFPGDPFVPSTNARMAIAKSSNGANLRPWDASRSAWGRFAARGGRILEFAKGKPGKPSKLVKTVGGATAGLIRKIRPTQTDRSARFDRLMAHVENWDADYGRQERRFNVTDEELVDADTGAVNVEAVKRKAHELARLIAIRRRIEHELEQAQVVVKRIIASYQRVIRALRNSLRHAKRKDRSGIKSYIDQYSGRVTEWKGKLGEVKDSLFDTHTDLLELRAERKSVLGTTAEARDTGADTADTGGDFGGGDIGGDTGAADTVEVPPTPLQIAEAAAAELRTFVTGRQDLLASFGRNVVPQSQAPATFGTPDLLTAAAGLRAFGGASTGGLGGATIINNYNQLPDNTQTWAQQMRFQVEGA